MLLQDLSKYTEAEHTVHLELSCPQAVARSLLAQAHRHQIPPHKFSAVVMFRLWRTMNIQKCPTAGLNQFFQVLCSLRAQHIFSDSTFNDCLLEDRSSCPSVTHSLANMLQLVDHAVLPFSQLLLMPANADYGSFIHQLLAPTDCRPRVAELLCHVISDIAITDPSLTCLDVSRATRPAIDGSSSSTTGPATYPDLLSGRLVQLLSLVRAWRSALLLSACHEELFGDCFQMHQQLLKQSSSVLLPRVAKVLLLQEVQFLLEGGSAQRTPSLKCTAEGGNEGAPAEGPVTGLQLVVSQRLEELQSSKGTSDETLFTDYRFPLQEIWGPLHDTLGAAELMEALSSALKSQHCDAHCAVHLVFYLMRHPPPLAPASAADDVLDMISTLAQSAFIGDDAELLCSAILLSRYCCALEGRLDYTSWVHNQVLWPLAAVGAGTSTTAQHLAVAAFDRLLPTDLLPYVELQVQALQSLPRRPKNVADYVARARDRLAGAPPPEAARPPVSAAPKSVREEVEGLLQDFHEHRAIPQQLFKYKMFRKPWLTNQLLPALFCWTPRKRRASAGGQCSGEDLLRAKSGLLQKLRSKAFLAPGILDKYQEAADTQAEIVVADTDGVMSAALSQRPAPAAEVVDSDDDAGGPDGPPHPAPRGGPALAAALHDLSASLEALPRAIEEAAGGSASPSHTTAAICRAGSLLTHYQRLLADEEARDCHLQAVLDDVWAAFLGGVHRQLAANAPAWEPCRSWCPAFVRTLVLQPFWPDHRRFLVDKLGAALQSVQHGCSAFTCSAVLVLTVLLCEHRGAPGVAGATPSGAVAEALLRCPLDTMAQLVALCDHFLVPFFNCCLAWGVTVTVADAVAPRPAGSQPSPPSPPSPTRASADVLGWPEGGTPNKRRRRDGSAPEGPGPGTGQGAPNGDLVVCIPPLALQLLLWIVHRCQFMGALQMASPPAGIEPALLQRMPPAGIEPALLQRMQDCVARFRDTPATELFALLQSLGPLPLQRFVDWELRLDTGAASAAAAQIREHCWHQNYYRDVVFELYARGVGCGRTSTPPPSQNMACVAACLLLSILRAVTTSLVPGRPSTKTEAGRPEPPPRSAPRKWNATAYQCLVATVSELISNLRDAAATEGMACSNGAGPEPLTTIGLWCLRQSLDSAHLDGEDDEAFHCRHTLLYVLHSVPSQALFLSLSVPTLQTYAQSLVPLAAAGPTEDDGAVQPSKTSTSQPERAARDTYYGGMENLPCSDPHARLAHELLRFLDGGLPSNIEGAVPFPLVSAVWRAVCQSPAQAVVCAFMRHLRSGPTLCAAILRYWSRLRSYSHLYGSVGLASAAAAFVEPTPVGAVEHSPYRVFNELHAFFQVAHSVLEDVFTDQHCDRTHEHARHVAQQEPTFFATLLIDVATFAITAPHCATGPCGDGAWDVARAGNGAHRLYSLVSHTFTPLSPTSRGQPASNAQLPAVVTCLFRLACVCLVDYARCGYTLFSCRCHRRPPPPSVETAPPVDGPGGPRPLVHKLVVDWLLTIAQLLLALFPGVLASWASFAGPMERASAGHAVVLFHLVASLPPEWCRAQESVVVLEPTVRWLLACYPVLCSANAAERCRREDTLRNVFHRDEVQTRRNGGTDAAHSPRTMPQPKLEPTDADCSTRPASASDRKSAAEGAPFYFTVSDALVERARGVLLAALLAVPAARRGCLGVKAACDVDLHLKSRLESEGWPCMAPEGKAGPMLSEFDVG